MPSTRDSERLRATIEAVEAPPQLRARVAEQLAGARERRRRRRRRWSLGGGLAAAAAAAAAVVAVVLPGGGGPPSVQQVAQASTAPPTLPAPAAQRGDPRWLRAHVGSVRFPSWRQRPGWRPTGARRDTIGGQRALTVSYAGPAGRLAYTVVDGSPLPWPDGARVRRRDGTAFRVVRDGARTVVTWREGGHQCVIVAPARMPEQRLLAMAGWAAGHGGAAAGQWAGEA